MSDCLFELLDEFMLNKPDCFCDVYEFKQRLFDKMLVKDDSFKEVFDSVKWVDIKGIGVVNGRETLIVSLNKYLESVYKDVVLYLDEDKISIYMDMFDEWESKVDGFFRASIGIPVLYSDEEFEEAERKSKLLLKRYAELKNLKMMKARMLMPAFDSPLDTVEWLEREIEKLEGDKN